MEMFAAFQKSLSFATFGTDTVPEPAGGGDRRAVRRRKPGELHSVVHELLPLEHAVLAHQKMEAARYSAGSCSCPRELAARTGGHRHNPPCLAK